MTAQHSNCHNFAYRTIQESIKCEFSTGEPNANAPQQHEQRPAHPNARFAQTHHAIAPRPALPWHGRHYQPQPLERVGESGNRKSLLFQGSMGFAKSTRTVPTAGVDRVKRIAGFRKRPGFPSESSYTPRSRPPKIFSVLYSLP